MLLALVPVAVLAVAALAIFQVRAARTRGAMPTLRGACQKCGNSGPLVAVHYRQNTGMLVARRVSYVKGSLCRTCSLGVGGKMSLHNLVLGWWGYISLVVTPIFLVVNLFHLGNTLALPPHDADLAARLDVQRDYALNLLATQDAASVADTIAKLTGVPEPQVRAWLDGLRRAA